MQIISRMIAAMVHLACWQVTLTAVAQDFRVETDVFVADRPQAVAESLTVFLGDVIYDFPLTDAHEVTVFDTQRMRLTLLDTERKVKTTLTGDHLLEISAAIQSIGGQAQEASVFSPAFATAFHQAERKLELTSVGLSYTVIGAEPQVPSAATRYQQFADWYARLNAVRPGGIPPFGRLELNAALAQRGLVPERVERRISSQQLLGKKPAEVRAQHVFYWTITGTDRKRVEQAAAQLASFPDASWRQFFKLDEVASTR